MTAGEPRLFPVEQEQLTSDDYYTPAWVFERMGIEFDIDVCSPPGGIPWIPAKRYFTQVDDGLTQLWEGRVWMNPPYSQTAPWATKFIAHGHGVCLVPHSRSAWWWSDLWNSSAAIADAGMFRFYKAGGKYENVFMPVVFAAFGDECVDAIRNLGVVRRIA